MIKRILVLGADGYLGKHLVNMLSRNPSNLIYKIDRHDIDLMDILAFQMFLTSIDPFDEIYQLAADSGSIDYLLSEKYSYGDSTLINLNVIKALKEDSFKGKILFPSSFYTANVENRYGLEKLYNEALYLESGLDVRIPTLFSVYGPGEKLNSPQEKVTTAFCRKVMENKGKKEGIVLEGHPFQTRYFLHVDDAIKGLATHMKSDVVECDIAGNEAITFEHLISTIIDISEQDVVVKWTRDAEVEGYFPTPNKLEWEPRIKFEYGMDRLYRWVENELS